MTAIVQQPSGLPPLGLPIPLVVSPITRSQNWTKSCRGVTLRNKRNRFLFRRLGRHHRSMAYECHSDMYGPRFEPFLGKVIINAGSAIANAGGRLSMTFVEGIHGVTHKVPMVAAVFFLMVLGQHVHASEAARVVMDRAQVECSSFNGGVLETDTHKTVSLADLTGDGRPEEIIDGNQFNCPTARTLFCGTGGCQLTVIVHEQPFEFLAKAWRVEKAPDGQTGPEIGRSLEPVQL